MTTLQNDTFLRALAKQPVSHTPVWLMRQAGRYLPEYRAVRARAGGFLDLCKNTELATEVTLQPIDRFGLDAAILFSDILTIPDAMGLGLSFVPGEGPAFDRPVRSLADVQALPIPDMNDDLGYVMQAVRLIKRELDGRVPLIGFAGSPWTLATYMIEGEASRDFARAKAMLYQEPRTLHALLDKLADIGHADKLAKKLGVDEARAYGFSGGVSILAALYQHLDISRAIVSQEALREGVLLELMGRDGGDSDERERTARALQHRFGACSLLRPPLMPTYGKTQWT